MSRQQFIENYLENLGTSDAVLRENAEIRAFALEMVAWSVGDCPSEEIRTANLRRLAAMIDREARRSAEDAWNELCLESAT